MAHQSVRDGEMDYLEALSKRRSPRMSTTNASKESASKWMLLDSTR